MRNLSPEKREECKNYIMANHHRLRIRTIAKDLSISHPTVLFHMYAMGIKTRRKSRIIKMQDQETEIFNVNQKSCWLIG